MYKEWMLRCNEKDAEGEWIDVTYYFDTKDEMVQFAKTSGVKVAAMFNVEKVGW